MEIPSSTAFSLNDFSESLASEASGQMPDIALLAPSVHSWMTSVHPRATNIHLRLACRRNYAPQAAQTGFGGAIFRAPAQVNPSPTNVSHEKEYGRE
jgi:hypothetical protein